MPSFGNRSVSMSVGFANEYVIVSFKPHARIAVFSFAILRS